MSLQPHVVGAVPQSTLLSCQTFPKTSATGEGPSVRMDSGALIREAVFRLQSIVWVPSSLAGHVKHGTRTGNRSYTL